MANSAQSKGHPLYSELLSEAKTNTAKNSVKKVTVTCPDLWTHVQDFCLTRARYQGITSSDTGIIYSRSTSAAITVAMQTPYAIRAKLIAATYARFYLETEQYGTKTKKFKGRYFWMALGAFASNQVKITLLNRRAILANDFHFTSTTDWLGKGNFWLFQDIGGWHYYNNRFGYQNFTACEPLRNWSSLNTTTKANVSNAKVWSAEALPAIKNLKTNDFIKVAFAAANKYTLKTEPNDKKELQSTNLLALADHEQRMILQPLIYNTAEAREDLEFSRGSLQSQLAPKLKLTFSAEDSTSDYDSYADKNIVLENVEDRMKWIYGIAKIFEGYMFGPEKNYMHKQLETMAGWL